MGLVAYSLRHARSALPLCVAATGTARSMPRVTEGDYVCAGVAALERLRIWEH